MEIRHPYLSVCPNCGDSTPARLRERAYGLDGDCRTTAISSVPWGELCVRRQLAAANERAGRLEAALREVLETPMNAGTSPYIREIARKELEVPDA